MHDIHLNVHAFGILVYSPYAGAPIATGANFLDQNFSTAEQVLPFVYEGSLVAFQTGDGFYRLRFRLGYPTEYLKHMLRLGVLVKDSRLCFRDLYDLYEWQPECPSTQELKLADGYYHLTICSEGDFSQNEVEIFVYLNPLEEMPALDFHGTVPVLFGNGND